MLKYYGRRKSRWLVRKILTAFILTAAAGCASVSRGDLDRSAQDEALEIARSRDTPDSHEFQAIDRLYRSKNYGDVLSRSKRFFKVYPSSLFLEQVYHLRALSSIALKQYSAAAAQLKKTLEIARARRDPNENLIAMATYNIAFVNMELSQAEQAMLHLNEIKVSSLDRPNRVKYRILRAKIARVSQDFAASSREILFAAQDQDPGSDGSARKPLLAFLDEGLDHLGGIAPLERLIGEFEDSPAADHLYYRAALYHLKSGDRASGDKYLEKIASGFPSSPYLGFAQETLKVARHRASDADPRKIGVLLTLSGKFGKIGYRALQGIELATGVFSDKTETPAPALVVMDDQGDPERAAQALEELYYKHGVIAVIGPISSKVADAAAKKARELELPLIAMNQKDLAGQDDRAYAFNSGLSPSMQARQLLRYAREKLKLQYFAMLSPASKFGEEYSKAFWDELDRKGGAMRGFETYPEDETDFRSYVDKLVGLNATDARAKEVEQLKLLKEATPVKTRSKKFDRMFDLKPIVDFDAVFIPDEPKVLGQILPTFAYRDVEKTLFLGINTWNNPELIVRAGQFAEGSVFVDGFYARSQKPSIRKFIEEYRGTFGAEPALIEATAFDAAKILTGLLENETRLSRSALRERIAGLKDFAGLSGKISCQDGRILKTIHMLTLKNGKIEEIAF
ncbi:MAG: penicillin-binding protein activator [Deltaproteobacteria bacterium]|nr:penicillin-binding protein activator [Deltaproteobacteria bacterium]